MFQRDAEFSKVLHPFHVAYGRACGAPLATSQRVYLYITTCVHIPKNTMHLLPLSIRASPAAAPANAPGWLGIGWLAAIGWLAIGWLAAIDWLATARWQLADLAWLAAN